MIKLTPSLLAADLLNLGRDVDQMMKNGIDRLHFDVMDAHFVPNLSFGPAFCRAIHSKFPELKLDVHLMMDNPEKYLDTFLEAGADSIIVHREVLNDPDIMVRKIHEKGALAGLSIKPATPVKALLHWLDETDIVLIMTVEPGFGGQKLMRSQIEKISLLRREGYQGVIAVDGGVTLENANLLKDAGANWLIMGTSYFRAENPALVARKIGEMQ
ncbi:MAG: ribulose-phosphate 3-epimerase [Clostridia bacterium]|nr:ribulose-phosphate 3-epimerase [Clostridia bacterium]